MSMSNLVLYVHTFETPASSWFLTSGNMIRASQYHGQPGNVTIVVHES
jgi:hypothetical protein